MNRFRRQPRTLALYGFPLRLSRLTWDNSMVSLDIRSRRSTGSLTNQAARPAEPSMAAHEATLFAILDAAGRVYRRMARAQSAEVVDVTPNVDAIRAEFEAAFTAEEQTELARLLEKITL